MSITSKWVGLGSYDLRLFLIKNRFFMTGDGIEANTKKLLALGFREVPKSAMKEGSRSYWSVPNEGDFLRRLVTAFPDYTVEMLPPEGINPTILVNRTRTLKGGNQNDAQQPRQRASNTGQPVVETPVRDLHAEPHAEPAVLVESGPQHDSGAESGNDAGDGARENVPPVVERDAGELRASGGDVPAAVETAQSSDGDSNVRRASELEQSSQDGQSGSANSVAGAELGASDADGARGRLLLDIDAVRIQSAMNRRVSLVDRVSDDSAELSQHVAKALEDGVYTRHEEFRQAYTSLEQQEQQLSLSQLFYSADHVDGVAGVVASLVKASSGDAYTTVGEAKSAFDSAGYGWLAEHIEPVLSFSDDPLQDTISLIRVKQIAADQLAIEAGVTGSATALAVDEKELAAKIVRAEMLAGLMALERMGRDQAAQLEAEVEQSVSADGVSDSAEADMMVDYRIFDKANQVRSAGISDLVRRVDSLKDSVDSAVAANDYSNELEFNALHNELYLEHVQLRIENQFFAVADDEGVAKVFNAFGDAQDIALDEAKAAFDSAGYGALYDQAMQMHFLFDPRSIASISVDNLKMRVVDRVVSLSGFDDTTDAAERDEAMFMDSLEDLAEVGAGILSLKEAAANAQSDQAIDPMLAEYAFFDMAYSAREKAVQKFYSEVSGLHRAVLRSLGLGDPSSGLQEFEAEHDELNRAVPDLKFENIFFERAAGQGVTKVFDAFKVDQDIALDEAKAAFDAAGYGALYENAMSVNEASNSQVTAISYSDLKLKIVDGIERMEIAYMNENNPFRGRDDQFELDYYVALDLLDDISSNIAQLRSEVEAIADSEVDFDDNENDEVDEPHYQAAVFLFREQRQSVGNRAEDDDVRRRTKELAAVTSVNHVRTIMVLDMIATRMDMESLQFAEDLEAAASAVDDDAQWMVQRVADDASNFTLAEYAELATVTKLENHGRKWDVRYGSDSGFSDAEDEAGAIADRHRGAVNNALYYNSPENPNPLKMPLPRAEVLAQYPDLITRFPTAFIVDRPEAVTAVTGHSVTYNVLGYDIIEYVNSSSGEPVQAFSVQADKGQSQAQGSVYSIDNNEIAYSLDAAVAIAVRQHSSLATQADVGEVDSNRVTVESAQKASVGDIVMTADGYEFVVLNDHAGTLQAGPIVNGIALDGMEDLITFQLTGEEGEFVDRDYRALFHVDRNYYRERQALEQESNANSQEQAGSAAEETSIVARLAALGYEVDVNALAPFEGVSETYRQLLAKTEVVVTGRELYDGFDAARAGADTQTLIMNAPRPLVGHSTFEADFFAGRYYALVNTAGDNAEFQVENNVKMDATLPVYMDQVTHFAFSLSSNRYSSQYLDMLESGTDFESVFSEVVRHKGYTIETLEAALSDFKASFAVTEQASLEQEPVVSGESDTKDQPFSFTLAEFAAKASVAQEDAGNWRVTNGSFTTLVDMVSDSQDALAVVHRSSVRAALEANQPNALNEQGLPIPESEVLLDYPRLVEANTDVFLVDRPDAKAALEANGLALAAYNVYGHEVYEVTDSPKNGNRVTDYFVQSHESKVAGLSDVYNDEGSYRVKGLNNALFSAREQLLKANSQLGLNAGAEQESLEQEPVISDEQRLKDLPSNYTLADFLSAGSAAKETVEHPWKITNGSFVGSVSVASDEQQALAIAHRISVRDALYLNSPDSENNLNVPIPRNEVLLDYPDHVNDFSDVFLVDRPDVAVEAMADNAQLMAAYNVYGYDLYELNVPDATSDTNIYYILQTHANSVNGQSTVLADADSLTDTQLRSVLASARRQYIRASKQDLDAGADEAVQPQTDDSNNRPLEGERVTPDSALRSKAGDIVRTEDGREFMMLRARQEFTEAYEIIDGKTQVSADTGVMFHLNPDSAGSYTQRDNSVLFHTGRNYHEEQRDALAAEQAQNEQPTSADLGDQLGGSDSAAPVAFNSDDDTGVDVREWAGLTLDDLKNAEENGGRKNFTGSVHSLNLLEQGTAIGSMQERHKNSLLQFTGWGGIYDEYRVDKRSNYNGLSVSKSLGMDAKDFNKILLENRLESYYTPANLIESMWKGVQRAGVPASGRYLEAGCGSGHFFVGAPADVQATGTLVGIECDPIAARFARAVAPDARIIEDRYENVVLDNNYDAVIGNVPFGSTKISDTRYPTAHYIHDYFIKRSLSHLKDGGLMAVITSAGTMDKADDSVRLDIMDSADLVAGVRLPSNTFGRDNAQVVTDILVFQKRPKGTEPSYNFTATQMLDVDDEKFRVNSFFVDNPQYVLGSTGTSSGPFGPRYDVIGGDLNTLSERVDLALNAQVEESLVQNATWKKAKVEQEQQVPAWDEDSYVVDDEELAGRMIGEIFISGDKLVEIVGTRTNFDSEGVRTSDSVLVADVVTTKARENILMSYVPLRDAAIALSKAQLSGEDSDIEWQQKETLKLYEGFVAKHGPANSRTVILAIQDDPLSSEVVALEVYNEDKKEVTRLAETLTKKVVGNADSSSVETAQDAFYVCIDRKGSVDFNYMAEISGLDQQTMKDELLGDLVYLNPKTHEIEQASSYLSGNVVKKLEEAEQAAMIDPQTYAANIAALNRVRPLLLPFEDISINLGASWVPADDIREFILNTCSKRDAGIRDVSVTYSQATGSWKVNTSGTFDKNNEIIMRSRFGTDRAKFTGLLELSLNGKKANHTYKDSEGKTHFDFEATMASRAKQEDIAEAFTAWTAATEERKEKLASIYNEKINVICPPKADGSRITFPGMSAAWKPRSHQSDIVAMGMMGQNIMAAHPVGSGKTFEMVALGMKLKGTGMATKPMIAVPNHMLAQMAREAKEIFPSAKVLMVTNDDLRFEKRKRFFAVARNNDWDLIVCTHSMLDRLKAPIDIRVQVIQDEIDIAQRQMDEIEGESGKRRITAKIATLESKLAVVIKGHEEAKGDPKKAPMELADIGVDTLLVDEAHLYKNLFLNTSMQVLGISSGGSDRATNLLEISQYLRELHGKATGLHFFTGTPIANSIAELYVHNRFLRPDILEGMGINTFDQWALNFGKTVDKAEVLADGSSIGVRTRFSEFQNLPELIKMFRTFADVRTLAELNLPTPKLNSYTHIIPQTQLGKDHMIHLAIRAVAARDSGNDPTKDNILKIIGDGRKAALDLQMVDPRLPDDASLKLQEVANNVFKHWEETHEVRGAQLAFMDMGTPKAGLDENGNKFFSGYEKLRSLLVEKGMPKEQIAFIHDAKNDTQKETMFRAVRNGDIRLLIGSTLKMGVGTNVQERLCALHNVDAPWRPDQLEQRIGRIMRQGNLFFDVVAEHRYVTQDSTEILMYDKLGTKDRFIKQAMSSPDTADRVATEEVDAGYADVMAAATGEPRIREKFEVDADVERLERRERTWVREQAYVRRSMDSMKREIQTERSHIDSYKAVQQALPKSTYQAITVRGSVFGVQEGDTTWLSATSAGVALITRIDSVAATISRTNERSQPLKANVGGVELMLERSAINQDIVFADLDGRSVPAFSIKSFKNPETVGRSVRSLYRAAGAIIESQKKIAVIEDNIARSPAVQAEWPQAEAYADLRKKKQELDEWFVKQDFDSRFAGIEDPFLLQLAKYADQHAQADASVESDMDGEIEDLFGDDDIERFDPNATDALGDDMSQADIDDDLDLGHEDYDVGVEGSDEAFDDKSPRAVTSRGASMGN